MNNKGVMSGRIIGKAVPDACIPKCYLDALHKAVEVANQ
jgi:hypothetical protein